MIKQINMFGIKGQNTMQELTGRDIIIGRNGAGKTTRMQALSLAAFGYVPERGKTAEATFELASEDTMRVGILTDNISIQREYAKNSKLTADGTVDVKIKQGITISPSRGESTIKQKEQRIAEAVGNFPTMLDFSSFIALTDNQKRDFIYNLSGDQFTWDRDKVEEALRTAVLREELYQNNPEMYEVMEKNCDDAMSRYGSTADVQSGLLAMTEHAKEQLSYWKKEKANADAAARKLTELKNRSGETDRNIADNQEKLKALEAERDTMVEELAKIKAYNHKCDEMQADYEKLTAEIAELETTDHEAKIEALTQEIAKLEHAIDTATIGLGEAKNKADAKREEDQKMHELLKDKREYIVKLEKEKIQIESTIKATSDLIESIHANAGFCAFSRDIPCGQNFGPFIEEKQNLIDECYEKMDILTEDINRQKAELEDMEARQRDIQRACGEAQVDADFLHDFMAEKSGEIADMRLELQAIENASPIIAMKASQKAEIEAWLKENPKIDEESKQEEIDALKAKIEALTATIDEQKKIRNDIMNIKANIIDSQTAAYEQECWSQITMALGQKGIQGKIVKEMLDPLRSLIDEKIHGMGLDKSFFFETENDRGKEIFRFGWVDRGAKRPFNALSQGEQLLLLIALMTTIIERSNPPIKILAIDNINHLDRQNLQKVIDGLNEAGKNMDNIILAGTPELTEADAPGWKVHNLSEA